MNPLRTPGRRSASLVLLLASALLGLTLSLGLGTSPGAAGAAGHPVPKRLPGDAAGTQLTALLHDHMTIAVELLQAAKAGDATSFASARTRWYTNADQIAGFLAAANPKAWPDDAMRADMKTHLDQTLAEASDELHGNYAASITDYEAIHTHILMMADQLSAGIIQAFPASFR